MRCVRVRLGQIVLNQAVKRLKISHSELNLIQKGRGKGKGTTWMSSWSDRQSSTVTELSRFGVTMVEQNVPRKFREMGESMEWSVDL